MTLDFESTEIYKNVMLKGQQLANWFTNSESTILIFDSVLLIFFDEGTLFLRNTKFNRFTLGKTIGKFSVCEIKATQWKKFLLEWLVFNLTKPGFL